MVGTAKVLFDEEEDDLAAQTRPMGFGRFHGNDWRSGLATGVAAGTGEAIHIDDTLVVRTEDREPCVQIFAKKLVLCRGVRLNRPNCIARYGHAIH